MLIKDLLLSWLAELGADPETKPNTLATYSRMVNNRLVPALGAIAVEALCSADLKAFIIGERAIKRDPKLPLKVLRAALGPTRRTAFIGVALPKEKKKLHHFLLQEQVVALLTSIREHRLWALYVLAIQLGMRLGELLGLHWEDLDLRRGTLLLHRQAIEIDGVIMGFGPLKNDEMARTLPLSPTAVKALKQHKARLEKDGLGASPLVFSGWTGGVMFRSSFREMHARFLKQAGLPYVRPHDLRHTCATLLLQQGHQVKLVAELLGHADVSVTQRVYGHVTPTMVAAAVSTMDAMTACDPAA